MTGDQREAWRKALAAKARQQRQQRGREQDASSYRPGMARITPPPAHNAAMGLAKCTMPGCPQRYRGGPDRPCPTHQDSTGDWAARMDEFGLPMAAAPGFPIDGDDGTEGQADGLPALPAG